MILPTPGPDPASRLFGYATPPDGAGPIGPDQLWPTPVPSSREDLLRGLNPLQHVPVLGMIYRLATGEEIPATMRVLGAAAVGGPVGALFAGVLGVVQAVAMMKPDLSRPSVPAGMSATGAESGVQPVTPGQLSGGAYTTLATVQPEWLETSPIMVANRGTGSYQQAASEWARQEAVEKGLA